MFAGIAIFFLLTWRARIFNLNFVYEFFLLFLQPTAHAVNVLCFSRANAILKDISSEVQIWFWSYLLHCLPPSCILDLFQFVFLVIYGELIPSFFSNLNKPPSPPPLNALEINKPPGGLLEDVRYFSLLWHFEFTNPLAGCSIHKIVCLQYYSYMLFVQSCFIYLFFSLIKLFNLFLFPE